MLNHPTHERLIELGLTGMAKAFEEQRRSPDLEALPPKPSPLTANQNTDSISHRP
ncbi:hypothetical protein ABIF91_009514 [Bradyrhizobium sp. USDA 241]